MFTNNDVLDKIENEGMEYFFAYYTSPDKLEDEKLRELATKFVAAHRELDKYVKELEKNRVYDE